MDIRFATQSYKHDSLPLSSQRLVNAFAESQPRTAKNNVSVHGCHGIVEFATCGFGPIRGGIEVQDVAYFVSGEEFWSVSSDGTSQLLGSGITGGGTVSMDGSDEEVVIVNGTNGYIFDIAGNSFSAIGDADFNAANTVALINSVFVYDWAGTNKFFCSQELDAGNIDALDFASAESSPDGVVCVRNRNGLLMVFGTHSLESWDHTGASDFPFSKIKGGTIDRGIAGPYAIVDEDASLFFLGDDRVFYRLNGLQVIRISTHAIERTWQDYTRVDDAFCFRLPVDGHKFIYITFPTAGATFGFDIATGLWHERMSWDPRGSELKWRVSCAVPVYNKILVGDGNSGKIGYLDRRTYTEFGDPSLMLAVFPPIYPNGKNTSLPCFEVDMETGVGLSTGQGSDPQVMLEYSTDGGRTYSAPQQWRTMGAIGAYQTRLQWRELGSAFHWTFKLSVTDPVKRTITGARLPFAYAEEN